MNKVLAAPNSFRVNRLSAGAATGSQVFHTCCWLYLIAFFILPDGFGFRLGFLWSAKRIFLFICYVMILFNRERLNRLWNDLKQCTGVNIFIILYLFVRLYTCIYRADIYCITNLILDQILVFFLFYYILKYEISIEQFIHFIRICLMILCIEAIWEVATKINLFGLINFAGEESWAAYATRAGVISRVTGNCHHPIHFGIYLSILFFMSCIDVKNNKLYLFRSPLLFVLASMCVFLTGSRAPLGIYIMCIFLICLFSNKDERIKSLIILFFALSVFALFTMIVYQTKVGQHIMFMLTNMWDAVFDTRYADNWGGTAVHSTEYREALAKVFQVDYFNKLMGRGASYHISVVIDGYWLRSCDNSYVLEYVQYAYPGLAMLILHGIIMLGYSLHGLLNKRKFLFGATLVITVCYFLNIWFVAMMGTYTYIWMLFALIYIVYNNQNKDNNLKEEVLK